MNTFDTCSVVLICWLFFPVVCDMYSSTVDTCSVLLGESERSGGEARCFKCSGAGQVEASLDAEAPLVMVCVKCYVNFGNVDFELDLFCFSLEHMDVIFGME